MLRVARATVRGAAGAGCEQRRFEAAAVVGRALPEGPYRRLHPTCASRADTHADLPMWCFAVCAFVVYVCVCVPRCIGAVPSVRRPKAACGVFCRHLWNALEEEHAMRHAEVQGCEGARCAPRIVDGQKAQSRRCAGEFRRRALSGVGWLPSLLHIWRLGSSLVFSRVPCARE